METEIKYMKLRTRNAKMCRLYGDKLTGTEKLINMRSNGLHSELQFTDRYGNISVSATKQDECNCVRFKMIGYSHAYRWSTVYIPVTAEQEALIFADACGMADLDDMMRRQMLEIVTGCRGSINPFEAAISDCQHLYDHPESGCYYGPNAIKYDTAGVSLSFISKRRWWNPSGKRQFCSETCGMLLLVAFPNLFVVKNVKFDWGQIVIPPHEQTPDDTEYLTRHFFNTRSNDEQNKA